MSQSFIMGEEKKLGRIVIFGKNFFNINLHDTKIEIDAVTMNLNASKQKFENLLALHVGGKK